MGRLGSKKSHSGCITCKVRKVKCDETYPICKRCSSTGRKCDGYGSSHKFQSCELTTRYREPPSTHPALFGHVNHHEVQSFSFFMHEVVPGFTRIVTRDFWHQVIPQFCLSDIVVRDAVNALSTLIRWPQYSRNWALPVRQLSRVTSEQHLKALVSYNKSINGLQRQMKNGTASPITTIVACIIYICLECLQDNVVDAFALYDRAVAILGMSPKSSFQDDQAIKSKSAITDTVRALLRHMAITQGLSIRCMAPQLDRMSTTFQTLSDAQEELYILIGETHEFIQHVNAIKISQAKCWVPPSELCIQQKHHETRLIKWLSTITELINDDSMSVQDEQERHSVMLVAYNHYFIQISACLSTYETAFDSFFSLFQSMVYHAGRAIMTSKLEARPVFVFEARVLPSLFFVAAKCRHPLVRRQATSLLRQGPKLENIWKADAMADVVELQIGIEESGSEEGIFCSQPLSLELPSEAHRIYRQQIVESPGIDGQPERVLHFGRWHQDENFEWQTRMYTSKM